MKVLWVCIIHICSDYLEIIDFDPAVIDTTTKQWRPRLLGAYEMVLDKLTVKEGTEFTVVHNKEIPQLKNIWTWQLNKCLFNSQMSTLRINNIYEILGQIRDKPIGYL